VELDDLLAPLRLPQRAISEIESIAASVGALASTAERRLSSIDDSAGVLVEEIRALRAALKRVEAKVDKLAGLEETIEANMQGLRSDLNLRMLAVEHEVRGLRDPIDHVALDVSKIQSLLPEPSDGPIARLKDTLTKN